MAVKNGKGTWYGRRVNHGLVGGRTGVFNDFMHWITGGNWYTPVGLRERRKDIEAAKKKPQTRVNVLLPEVTVTAPAPGSGSAKAPAPAPGSGRGRGRGRGRGTNIRTVISPDMTDIYDLNWIDARNNAMQRGWGEYYYNGIKYRFADDELADARANYRDHGGRGITTSAPQKLDDNFRASDSYWGDDMVRPEDEIYI